MFYQSFNFVKEAIDFGNFRTTFRVKSGALFLTQWFRSLNLDTVILNTTQFYLKRLGSLSKLLKFRKWQNLSCRMYICARFGIIGTILKKWKHPWRSVATACNFTKSNTPPWVFFTFLNCKNGTKSRKSITFLSMVLKGLMHLVAVFDMVSGISIVIRRTT